MAVHDGDIGTPLTQSIPEPHTYALMLAGLAAVALGSRRLRSRKVMVA